MSDISLRIWILVGLACLVPGTLLAVGTMRPIVAAADVLGVIVVGWIAQKWITRLGYRAGWEAGQAYTVEVLHAAARRGIEPQELVRQINAARAEYVREGVLEVGS